MKSKFLSAFSLMILSVTPLAQTQPSSVPNALQGGWTLTSIYRTSNVTGPSVTEERKLLNTRLTYSPHRLESCGQSTEIASVQVQRVNADDFLQNTHARFNEVKVTAADISEAIIHERKPVTCFGAFPLPGEDVYIRSKDELLIDFEGVFYRALRAK